LADAGSLRFAAAPLFVGVLTVFFFADVFFPATLVLTVVFFGAAFVVAFFNATFFVVGAFRFAALFFDFDTVTAVGNADLQPLRVATIPPI
jgi:hypothetical protein